MVAGSFFVGERPSMLQSINNETRLNRIGKNHTTYFRVGSQSATGGVSSCVVRRRIISLSLYIRSYESPLISSTYEGAVDRS